MDAEDLIFGFIITMAIVGLGVAVYGIYASGVSAQQRSDYNDACEDVGLIQFLDWEFKDGQLWLKCGGNDLINGKNQAVERWIPYTGK